MTHLIHIRYLWLMLGLLLLSGCISRPPQYQPVTVEQASRSQAWEMRGKLAIRTDKDKLTSHLYWLHTPDSDKLILTTLLGIEILSLSQNNDGAKLRFNGKHYVAANAQALLQQVTGWSLPIDSLPLWITGQAATGDEIQAVDQHGRPRQLTSRYVVPAWSINYLSWQQQSGAQVPRLLRVKSAHIQMKIQLDQWQALSMAALDPKPVQNKPL